MIGLGLAIAIISLWQTAGEDLLVSNTQQQAAEVEPLVQPTATALNGDLEIGEVFAKLHVPKFGESYVRQIAEGTSLEQVLNTVGIGHYVGTALPGEIGNFALAGHRAGNGGPMRDIDKLGPGDLVYVETATEWFSYKYLETKIVSPTAVEAIAAKPIGLTVETSNDRFLTLTSCTPIYVNTERIVVWFEQVASQPKSEGKPF